jgi:serine/threonine-protein kinase
LRAFEPRIPGAHGNHARALVATTFVILRHVFLRSGPAYVRPAIRILRFVGVPIVAGQREPDSLDSSDDREIDGVPSEPITRKCSRCGEELVAGEDICTRCGAIVGTLKTPLVIDGRYSVERTLGAGSMGVVHLARDTKLGRRVAIKMIAPEMAAEPLATGRFAREAATLAAIRSEHVVRVMAFGKHGSAHFFVMEYVHGRDVDDIITAHANHGTYVPSHRALAILRQVAKGLTAVHSAGIVHRDVKPGNVVIEEETGRPVLVDFGLARSIERGNGKARSTVGAGTPWYMAPEQADDDEEAFAISPRTDVYALACTAFELFTARPPFDSTDPDELMSQHLHETPPLVSAIRPEMRRFDDVIARALSKIPSRRYESAEAFVAALEAVAREDEIAMPAPISAQRADSVRRAGVRAMVITDDDVFLQTAARAMQRSIDGPVTVTSASTMLEASAIAQWNPPQLVLLDDDTHKLDGVVTLSRFRATPYGSLVRALVASERPVEDEQWRYEVVGVRTFVRKPAEHDELAMLVADLAQRAGWK